jgi:hypothetical protein
VVIVMVCHAGAGVSIIMRYTLRLLTIQQFQRAATLIASCEVERRRNLEMGLEPFESVSGWAERPPNTLQTP